jgi:hypothetical protein
VDLSGLEAPVQRLENQASKLLEDLIPEKRSTHNVSMKISLQGSYIEWRQVNRAARGKA